MKQYASIIMCNDMAVAVTLDEDEKHVGEILYELKMEDFFQHQRSYGTWYTMEEYDRLYIWHTTYAEVLE